MGESKDIFNDGLKAVASDIVTSDLNNFFLDVYKSYKSIKGWKDFFDTLNAGIKSRCCSSAYFDGSNFGWYVQNYKPFDEIVDHVKNFHLKESKEDLLDRLLRWAEDSAQNTCLGPDDRRRLNETFKFVYDEIEKYLTDKDKPSSGETLILHAIKDIQGYMHAESETFVEKLDEIDGKCVGVSKPTPVIHPWIPRESKLDLTYRYNVENLSLIGRETEMETLEAFCKEKDLFLWYALCGPGGSGKSRLAYEFARKMKKADWEVYWLKEEEYAKLGEASFDVGKPVLIIADYVLMHTDAIGAFIRKTQETGSTIRLLLIERADEDFSKSDMYDMREYPIWNSLRLHSKVEDLKENLYKDEQQDFLFLSPLTDEALLKVIEQYAEQIPNRTRELSEEDCGEILERLKEVDEKYRRPLYARILVLLWANVKKWEKYTVADLMQMVLDREIDRWKKYLCDESNENAHECLVEVLAIVTMNGGISAKKLQTMYPKIYAEMNGYLDNELPTFFERNGMLDLTSDDDAFLCPVEPDLFGEYLVLRWLIANKRGMKKRLNTLFDEKWYENTQKTQFLLRLIRDYEETITSNNMLGNLFWKNVLTNDSTGILYLLFMADLLDINKLSLKLRKKVVAFLESGIQEDSKTTHMLCLYLSMHECKGRKRMLSWLEKLYKTNEGNAQIVFFYAGMLKEQTMCRDLLVSRSCVSKLKELHKTNKGNKYIEVLYAEGLVNQSRKEDSLCGVRECVAELEKLHKTDKGDKLIAVRYGEGLLFLSYKGDLTETRRCVEKLEELQKANGGNEALVVNYAQGLLIQSYKEDLTEARRCVEKLEELQKANGGNKALARNYARCLLCRSEKEDLTETRRCVEKLEELHNANKKDVVIAIRYALGLGIQSDKEDLSGTRICISKIEELGKDIEGLEKYVESEGFTIIEGLDKCIEELDKYIEELSVYPSIEELEKYVESESFTMKILSPMFDKDKVL